MALLVSSPRASGTVFVQRRDGSHCGIALRKLSGTKQPYEVEPQTRSHAGTATPAFPFLEKCWTSRLRNLSVPTNR